mgnify:CR=1 FL=1
MLISCKLALGLQAGLFLLNFSVIALVSHAIVTLIMFVFFTLFCSTAMYIYTHFQVQLY